MKGMTGPRTGMGTSRPSWNLYEHALAILLERSWRYWRQKITENKKFWEEFIAYFPWYDTGNMENDASNNSSIFARAFVTAVMFLPSRCLATIGLGTRWRWVVTFTTRPPYPRGKNTRYPLDRRPGRPPNLSGRRREKKNLTFTGIRTPTPRPSRP
jgi:hypothetical protein